MTTHEGPLVFGECKWREDPMDVSVLRTLEQRAAQFDVATKLLFGFSRAGFTPSALAYAGERPNLRLVSLSEMFEREDE